MKKKLKQRRQGTRGGAILIGMVGVGFLACIWWQDLFREITVSAKVPGQEDALLL
jgi:cytoskeletal protein RodZ